MKEKEAELNSQKLSDKEFEVKLAEENLSLRCKYKFNVLRRDCPEE